MTKRLFINDDGASAYVAIVQKDAPPVPATAEHNRGKSDHLYARQPDMALPSGTLIEVYVEQSVPTAREVAEALIRHLWDNDLDHGAQAGSPYDLAARWHRAGRP